MNVAIEITCLIIEVAEKGVELKVDGNRLRVHANADIDTELRRRLRTHQTAIIERFNYEGAHPDPFDDFIDESCLFFAGEGMATPIAGLDATYRHWAQDNEKRPASLVLLHKRLRRLGCEEIRFQGAPWWEHIALTINQTQPKKDSTQKGDTDVS